MSLDIKKLFQLTGHSGDIYTATINDKGKFLFTGGADKVVAMWSLDDFTPQKFAIKTDNSIYSLLYLKTLNHLSEFLLGKPCVRHAVSERKVARLQSCFSEV